MKLTKEQRDRIIDAYLSSGFMAANKIAAEYGVTKSYVKNLRFRRKLPMKEKKKNINPRREDHRWQWAKERGGVVA